MFYIPFPFLLPILLVICRTGVPAIMPMPETAVYKYRYFLFRKHKIGMAFDRIISPPASDTILFEYFNQAKFCRLVLLWFDLPHDIRAFFFIKHIRHSKSPCLKFNAETWIGFSFQYNIVVAADNIRQGRVTLCFVK